MELTRTVNADKRYYIDEGLVTNPEAFLETVQVFHKGWDVRKSAWST